MHLETHKRILSILHIVTGALSLVLALFISTILQVVFPFIQEEIVQSEGSQAIVIIDMVLAAFRAIFIFLLLLIPVPSIIGGIALLNNKKWGFILLLISGCLSLLNIPVGTAKGVYTLWVYFEDQKANERVED